MRRPITAGAIAACVITVAAAQQGGSNEWRFYGGDAGSTKYSPLDQINAANVGQLRDRLAMELARQRDRARQTRKRSRALTRTRRSW